MRPVSIANKSTTMWQDGGGSGVPNNKKSKSAAKKWGLSRWFHPKVHTKNQQSLHPKAGDSTMSFSCSSSSTNHESWDEVLPTSSSNSFVDASSCSSSSSSSVSAMSDPSLSEPVVVTPKRRRVIIDVDEIIALNERRSAVIHEIPKSIQIKKAVACSRLASELQDEIKSRTWKNARVCRPTAVLPKMLQSEITSHIRSTQGPTPVLSRDLQREITSHVRVVKSVPKELLIEIVDHVQQKPLKKELPPSLLNEIKTYQRPHPKMARVSPQKRPKPTMARVSPQKAAAVRVHKKKTTSAAASKAKVVSKQQQDKHDESVDAFLLAKKCQDLTKLTETLATKLLKDSMAKQHQKDVALQLVRRYQKDILQIERQHQAHLKQVNGNMKHLESQLRRYKVESVPPVVSSPPNMTKAQMARAVAAFSKKKSVVFEEFRQKTRRESAADLTAAVSSCLRRRPSTSSSKNANKSKEESPKQQRLSYTMASGILLQNQYFPAMLSAVARTSTGTTKR